MNTRNLIAYVVGTLAVLLMFGPSVTTEMDFSTSPQGITFHSEAYTSHPEPTPTPVQTVAALCTTDTDCVTRHPEIIPDIYTIDDYLRVWGDNIQFPTIGDCSSVDWLAQNEDGRPFVPVDLNHDGAIDCDSDYELGA